MDKNYIIAGVLGLLVLVSGYYFLNNKQAETGQMMEETANDTDEAMMDDADEAMMDDDSKAAGEAMMDDGEAMMAKAENTFELDSFMFGYSETTLNLKAGETYTVKLTNSAGMHDFVIDELDVRSKIIKEGEETSVTFTVPESAAGETYEFYCSVGDHRSRGMMGDVVIE